MCVCVCVCVCVYVLAVYNKAQAQRISNRESRTPKLDHGSSENV